MEDKTMENKEKEFFLRCPNCGLISGFFLDVSKISDEEEFPCSFCSVDSDFLKWRKSCSSLRKSGPSLYKYQNDSIDFFKKFAGKKDVLLDCI